MNWGSGHIPVPNFRGDGQQNRRRSPVRKILRSRPDLEGEEKRGNTGNVSDRNATHLSKKKKMVKSDIYGNVYEETSDLTPVVNKLTEEQEQRKKECHFRYLSMRKKIQSFLPSQQSHSQVCEDLFRIYCQVLELQSHVNINTKIVNRIHLTSYDLEVSHGSFYWEQFNGEYLYDADQAREFAFAVGCVALIDKFGCELRFQLETNNVMQSNQPSQPNCWGDSVSGSDQKDWGVISNQNLSSNCWLDRSQNLSGSVHAPNQNISQYPEIASNPTAIPRFLPPHMYSALFQPPLPPPLPPPPPPPPPSPSAFSMPWVSPPPPPPPPPPPDTSPKPMTPSTDGMPVPAFTHFQQLLQPHLPVLSMIPPPPPPPSPPLNLPDPEKSKNEQLAHSNFVPFHLLVKETGRVSYTRPAQSSVLPNQFLNPSLSPQPPRISLLPYSNAGKIGASTFVPKNPYSTQTIHKLPDFKIQTETESQILQSSCSDNLLKMSPQHEQPCSYAENRGDGGYLHNESVQGLVKVPQLQPKNWKEKKLFDIKSQKNLNSSNQTDCSRLAFESRGSFSQLQTVSSNSFSSGGSPKTPVKNSKMGDIESTERCSSKVIHTLVNTESMDATDKTLNVLTDEKQKKPTGKIFTAIVSTEYSDLEWLPAPSENIIEKINESNTCGAGDSISLLQDISSDSYSSGDSPKTPAENSRVEDTATRESCPSKVINTLVDTELIDARNTTLEALATGTQNTSSEKIFPAIVNAKRSDLKLSPGPSETNVEKISEAKSVLCTESDSLSSLPKFDLNKDFCGSIKQEVGFIDSFSDCDSYGSLTPPSSRYSDFESSLNINKHPLSRVLRFNGVPQNHRNNNFPFQLSNSLVSNRSSAISQFSCQLAPSQFIRFDSPP